MSNEDDSNFRISKINRRNVQQSQKPRLVDNSFKNFTHEPTRQDLDKRRHLAERKAIKRRRV